MSGYHRMSKLKGCINSFKNLKSINSLSDTLGKEIDALCSKAKIIHDSTGSLTKIKELNHLLGKEFNKATAQIKTGSGKVFNIANENARSCKNKLEETCKPLYSLPDVIEEKKTQYKKKYLKSRHIRKEAAKLCKNLAIRQSYNSAVTWSVAGLTFKDDKASTAVDAASKAAVRSETSSKMATVLDKNNTDYFVVKTGKYAEEGETASPTKDDVSTHLIADGVAENPIYSSEGMRFPSETTADGVAENPIYLTKETSFPSETTADGVAENAIYSSEETSFPLETTGSSPGVVDAIPDPPPIPDFAAEALNQLNALGEPTFASLGLGGWTPVGLVQTCMEFLHVTTGIDWWVAIVIGTLVIRICMFPLVIIAQRNAAKMNNCMPQMQLIQMKLSEARQSGDSLGAARYSQELMAFMNEKGLNPLKNMVVPLVQAPIFISFFMGLRQMANVPVDSLRHGGIFWFTDLTLPDQYFLLPAITSLTLWLTIELGTDTAKLSSQNMVVMKYVLRALPLAILPFTFNFPGAILCYWVSSNFISLGQVAFLRIPKVRDYFKIEPMMNFTPDQFPVKPKGFTEGIKETWSNLKISRELEERRKLDEMQFRRAGKGPVQKTYTYDPTRQTSPGGSQAPISAKKR